MLILITNNFPVLDSMGFETGRYELLVDFAVDTNTGRNVCVPNEHPRNLGGVYDKVLQEWVIV